jgi:hypothetical protein
MKRAMLLAFKVTWLRAACWVGAWLVSECEDGESNAQHNSCTVLVRGNLVKLQQLLCNI